MNKNGLARFEMRHLEGKVRIAARMIVSFYPEEPEIKSGRASGKLLWPKKVRELMSRIS